MKMARPIEPASKDPAPIVQTRDRVRFAYPKELTPEERAQVLRSRVVDAERYIEWLETGEGPDPWDESSG